MNRVKKPHNLDLRQEEGSSFSGSGLCAGHKITLLHDEGNGVLLNGSGLGVTRFFNVFIEQGAEVGPSEVVDGGWHVFAGTFDLKITQNS